MELGPAVATLAGRDLLRVRDLNAVELDGLLELAARLKHAKREGRSHALCPGRTLGMIFEKQSTRTRVSFEVGMYELGGYALHLSAQNELQLGRGETLADTGMVLSRYLDVLMVRTYAQSDIEELAEHASIPVINGLTDESHPCQALADLLTLRERFGSLRGRRLAYVGDAGNVCRSLVSGAALAGMQVAVASPDGYGLDAGFASSAEATAFEHGGGLRLVGDPGEAARGADALATDVWVSMGQEAERETRLRDLAGFRVDEQLVDTLAPAGVVLHCLPAHWGEEITREVLYGPRSAVWDEAENRLHAQKAVLAAVLAAPA